MGVLQIFALASRRLFLLQSAARIYLITGIPERNTGIVPGVTFIDEE